MQECVVRGGEAFVGAEEEMRLLVIVFMLAMYASVFALVVSVL
jgi:hypothetical protein